MDSGKSTCLGIIRIDSPHRHSCSMPLDEFPYVLRGGADSLVGQMFRDLPRTLTVFPGSQYLITERHQNTPSFAVLLTGVRSARKTADRKKLFGTVMPVFRGFTFQLPIGFGSVERQQCRFRREVTMGGNQHRHPCRFARNQQADIALGYFRRHGTTSLPVYFRMARERSVWNST